MDLSLGIKNLVDNQKSKYFFSFAYKNLYHINYILSFNISIYS